MVKCVSVKLNHKRKNLCHISVWFRMFVCTLFEMYSSHLAGVCTDSFSVYANMCTVYYELSGGGGYRKRCVNMRGCETSRNVLFVRMSLYTPQ